jgi:hypothetical protein
MLVDETVQNPRGCGTLVHKLQPWSSRNKTTAVDIRRKDKMSSSLNIIVRTGSEVSEAAI